VSKCAPQWALRALSDAWKRCFKKIAKPPKFKKKGKQDSFTLDGSLKVAHQKIKVPGIGWLKTYERLPYRCQPKSVTISKKADRWFISFKIEIEQQTTEKIYEVVGCDLGVKSLATLSTGEIFEGAKSYRKYEKKLSRLQYLNRRKIKGSSNWKKAQRQIAKFHF